MKKKTKDLRSRNPVELQQELLELLRAQFGLRMQHTTQQLSNTNQLRNVRRDIARAKTILSQKAKQS
ncbi:LSU ribosomal protein L29P [Nitrosospira sp. Nsp11]|uniref:50S ribosomal protein L29 n=1 Tax=unclassified Nitrosospira TaxID=2609267 RepID=UPI0008816E66|nr:MULTISPECIES: 50S ribosomal protein L29 [unclassified Nitrosospira]SDA17457.1 LSU ribosomal protein L29P [Nitrosospira sp. Nsp18]SHL50606.1 LSU ribosomal protein L29P [Nitrosospira sp. Nsp11]